MRVDSDVNVVAWLGSNALVVGGAAGLYLFGFLTGASSVTAMLDGDRPSELAQGDLRKCN